MCLFRKIKQQKKQLLAAAFPPNWRTYKYA